MDAPCASNFNCAFNEDRTRMARTFCCYATQPLKAVGSPGLYNPSSASTAQVQLSNQQAHKGGCKHRTLLLNS